MREIKCRSYNESEKCFYYFRNGRYYDTEDLRRCISERVCKEFKWINAEQYIGLRDKNGKEVFEGDTVTGGKVLGAVAFNGGSFICSAEDETGHYIRCDICDVSDMEVIVNIHKNPQPMEES